jgi:hypothetical protein
MFTTSSGDGSSQTQGQSVEPIDPYHSRHNIQENLATPTPEHFPKSTAYQPGRLQINWGLLRKLKRASLIAKQKGLLQDKAISPDVASDGLEGLREVARRGELQKAAQVRQQGIASGDDRLTQGTSALINHSFHFAAPLSPLKERDEKALTALFHRQDMLDVMADVSQCLLQLLPEPCWEDDPLDDLLREFL